MLKIILVENDEELGLPKRMGEKDVSGSSLEQAHEEGQKMVGLLSEYKRQPVMYQLEQNGQIVVELRKE